MAAWLLILAVVAILVGPFLALKAVSRFRGRRRAANSDAPRHDP